MLKYYKLVTYLYSYLSYVFIFKIFYLSSSAPKFMIFINLNKLFQVSKILLHYKISGVMLMRIALNLSIALCNIYILTMLIPPIHEHKISSYFFVYFSISFNNSLQTSVYKSFTSFKFIPRYFIPFVAIAKGTVFSTSFSEISLLVYRNAENFCTLILYPATLLYLLIVSHSLFQWNIQCFLYNKSYHLKKVTILLLHSQLDDIPNFFLSLTSFSCLIALPRPFSTMLDKIGESGHPCLIPGFQFFTTECDIS